MGCKHLDALKDNVHDVDWFLLQVSYELRDKNIYISVGMETIIEICIRTVFHFCISF